MRTVPSSGSSRPAITRKRVDLPLPLVPSRAVSEPPAMATETSSRAAKSQKRFVTPRTAIDTGCLLSEEVHEEEGHEREGRENHRRGVGAYQIEGLKSVLDMERQRLGLADEVARDDRDGPELAERARRRQDDAVRDAPPDRRQRDPTKRGERRSAECPGSLLLLGADLPQDGNDLADDEGKRDEDRHEHHRRQREDDLDSMRIEPRAEPARAGIDEKERKPDDDRRESEGKVDDRVQKGLPPEALANDDERAQNAEDRVQRDGDERDQDRQPEGMEELRVGHRVPEGREAVLERPEEDEPDRKHEQKRQVCKRRESEAVSSFHASIPSGGAGRSPAGPGTKGRAARRRLPRRLSAGHSRCWRRSAPRRPVCGTGCSQR